MSMIRYIIKFQVERKTQALVIGHSFVVGLHDDFVSKYKRHHPSQLEQLISDELKLSFNVVGVWLWGLRGATVKSLRPPEYLFSQVQPGVVVIDLGSNDIVQGSHLESIIAGLLDLANWFLSRCSQLVVVFLSVVPRTGALGVMSVCDFKERMKQCNDMMKQRVSELNDLRIVFVMQRGFYEIQLEGTKVELPVIVWSDDGVHPHFKGKEKYKNSLRTAICVGLKRLKLTTIHT
jgi:hypothetical protein